MNKEEVFRMAQEADPFGDAGRLYVMAQLTPETLERFAALVASAAQAKEREECAGLCDRFANRMMSAEECADAIRARG